MQGDVLICFSTTMLIRATIWKRADIYPVQTIRHLQELNKKYSIIGPRRETCTYSGIQSPTIAQAHIHWIELRRFIEDKPEVFVKVYV